MQNVNDVKIINFKDIKSVKTDFLWYPYIAFGKITLIHGNPGDGKTFLSLKLAAEVSNGRALPGMPESNAKPLPVIYQTAEDGLEDTIKPRLEDTDANMENIYAIDEEDKALTFADPRIEDAIVKTGARLLIFDPLQAFIGKDVDMNKANQVREGLRPLCRLAAKYNVAIILIGHLNKAQGLVSICRQIGSMDITATVRSVLIVGRHKDDPSIRVIVHDKSSLAPEGTSVAFTLSGDSSFQWLEGYEDVTSADVLGAQRTSRSKRCTKLNKAVEFLEGLFKNHSTTVPSKEVYARAMEAVGCDKRTVDYAKTYVPGLDSRKLTDHWVWFIDESQIPTDDPYELSEDDLPYEILDDDSAGGKEGCKDANNV